MAKKIYLGFDTSCYTTSVCAIDEAGELVGEARKILEVKPGNCGLMQSEMVFQHTRNLPGLVENVFKGQVSFAKNYFLVSVEDQYSKNIDVHVIDFNSKNLRIICLRISTAIIEHSSSSFLLATLQYCLYIFLGRLIQILSPDRSTW